MSTDLHEDAKAQAGYGVAVESFKKAQTFFPFVEIELLLGGIVAIVKPNEEYLRCRRWL